MSAIAPFAWVIVVALGVVLAAWMQRDRDTGTWNWARAALAGPVATASMAGVWALIRGFDYLAGGKGPVSWVGVSRDVATDRAPLDDTILRLGLGAGLVFALALIVLSRMRPRLPRTMPLAMVGGAIAALCAVAVAGVFASDPVAFAAAMPVDLAAFVPVGAAGIALAFLHVRVPVVAAPAPATTTTVPERATQVAVGLRSTAFDAEGLLRAAKLIAAPTFAVEGQGGADAATTPLDRTWGALGGAGRAPSCVEAVLSRLRGDAAGAMVTDLPRQTEDAVASTLVVAAIQGRAARVLVVCDEPSEMRDRVVAALRELGVERPGPMVAGDGELRDALAHNTLPAMICLAGHDLAGSLLAARTQRNTSWARHVELVVLVGVDRCQPIAASHLAFALRRTSLVLDQQRARVTWCAFGGSSAGSQRFVEDSTMTAFERIPLGATTSAPVRVFVRPTRADGDGATAELEVRARTLAGNGLDVQTSGIGDEPDGYRGDCSLLVLDDRHLVPLFLARTNALHRIAATRGHVGLWWIDDTPLSRFLLRDGALLGLEQRGELQTPRPVAGLDNIYLASAHLEAALHDGAADELGLRRAFGDRAVDQLLTTAAANGAARARWDATSREIERAPIIPAAGSRTSDPRRDTVSASTVEVKSSRQGEVLMRVDRRVAPTRFYPHRVFRAAGALYQVGGDTVADACVVKPAPTGATPTIPQLALELADARWVEAPKQVQIGKMSFARGTIEVVLRERVSGVISRDKGTVSVKYAAVPAEYPTRATVVMFADKPSTSALDYAGAMTARLVPSLLLVEPDDVGVVSVPTGVGGVHRPGMVFVDRHLGGIGVAEALDATTIHNLFRWTWGILFRCKCMNGCDQCTPADILQAGTPDKIGALKLLGG